MSDEAKKYRMQDYYSRLSAFSFPTVFISLKPEETAELAQGNESGEIAKDVIRRIREAVSDLPVTRFVSVDTFSPTDTSRFQNKRGAVSSPKSIWGVLCGSQKVREKAAAGEISCICIRPFRRMDVPREFRLFIKGGKLAGMSQYWLVRHFRRLVEREKEYMKLADKFVKQIAPFLPDQDIVADIYITHARRVILIDLNGWGGETDPKMFQWDREWNTDSPAYGIVPSPMTVSGEVKVKF